MTTDNEAVGLELDTETAVTETDALRVELAAARIQHAQADVARAQAVLRATVAEKDTLFCELRDRYRLGPGDGVDFSSRKIVRAKPGQNGSV